MPIAPCQHWLARPALIAASLVGVTATSAAAATWSPVQSAGTAAFENREPGVVFASDGTALISWSAERALRQPGAFAGRLAVRRADGALTSVESIAEDLAAPPVRFRANRVALLRERRAALDRHGAMWRVSLSVSYGRVGTPVQRMREAVAAYTAVPSDQDAGPAIAASPGGEVAVAWVQLRRGSTDRYQVRVSTGRPGHGFAPPRTLATGSVGTRESQAVAVAYGAAGELVIAYGTERPGTPRRRVVAALARSPDGTFGRPQILGPRDGLESVVVAAGARGRAVVAWGTHDSGEENSRPWVVRAAVRRGHEFGAAQVLDPGGTPFASIPDRIALALTDDGRATLVWANAFAGANPVKVATTNGGGRFGASTQLAPSGAVGDVAVSATGATLVTWTSFEGVFGGDHDTRVMAAVRSGESTAFGPPEAVGPPMPIAPQTPRAAFVPRTDTAVVVWSTSPPSLPPTAPQAVIQLATRTE
jgi:hypothetical protein